MYVPLPFSKSYNYKTANPSTVLAQSITDNIYQNINIFPIENSF